MKGKPKLPDFTTEREKNIKKRYKIYTAVAIIFALLSIGGIIAFGLKGQDYANSKGLLCIYEGVIFLIIFLFHIITWKKYGWEQISVNEFKIYKMTGFENKERKKEQEAELLIIDFIACVTSVVFIIIGIIKLF